MIYKVRVRAPALDEVITAAGDTQDEAKVRAVTIALQNQVQADVASAEIIDPPPEEEAEPLPPPPTPRPPAASPPRSER